MSQLADTAGALLQWAVGQLRAAGVDSPALDAELLLSHALNCKRASLLGHPERALDAGQIEHFVRLVARRASREPVAYILGTKEFYGLDFAVNRHVLVPRPETEDLVELALAWLRRRQIVVGAGRPPIVVDVGAGSGAIAIALAHHFPDAIIYAVDASAEALEVARANAQRHGLTERILCDQGDLLKPAPAQIDLIVANLPYIETGEIGSLMPEVSRHEPRMALDGGVDGLDEVRRLLREAHDRLCAGGAIMLEIGAGQGATCVALGNTLFPHANVSIEQDLAGLDRILVVDHLG